MTAQVTNVAAHLPRWATHAPEALAVAIARPPGRGGYDVATASELDADSDRVAHALTGIGITRGTRCVLMVPPSLPFFALTFGMLKCGAVPVLVDPGMGIRNLGPCLRDAEPEAFIGIAKAHLARLVLGWGRPTVRTVVSVGSALRWGGHRLRDLVGRATDQRFDPIVPDPEDPAAILFTSGSTGAPKGVVTPHRVFCAQVDLLRRVFGIEPGERDLATFPLFALFGPALGMASIVPHMDASRPATADPRALLRAASDHRCTNMFASPAIVELLGRHCSTAQVDVPSLRRVISAGAPASIPSLERLSRHLPPDTPIHTPYGATEALPVATIDSGTLFARTRARTERGAGACVGRPVPGIDVAILPISDDPVATWDPEGLCAVGEVGEICVKGPVVTDAYYGKPAATAAAKIADPRGGLWHRMGDLGYVDDEGLVWMCGRKSHRVVMADDVLFTTPCEAIFNLHPEVRRSALVGVRRGDADVPVICVELEDRARPDPRRLFAELRERAAEHPHTRAIDTFLVHPRFPVDVRHNSKIFREKLAVWAASRIPQDAAALSPPRRAPATPS